MVEQPLIRDRARDYRGRFSGERHDLENLPRLPTFPARWVLSDPRRRPYFVFWTRDGSLSWLLFMWRVGQGEAVRIWSWGGDSYTLPIIRRPLPRRGGTAILYRCPGCQHPRRYLYPLRVVHGVAVDDLGPRCHACLGLRWISQGCYRGAFDQAFRAALHGPGRHRDPFHREPWDPRAVSDPRMVMDEFPELTFKGTFPADGAPACVPEKIRQRTGPVQARNGPHTCDQEPPQGREDDGLEAYVPIPPVTDALAYVPEAIRRPQPPPRSVPAPPSWLSA